MSEGTGGRRVSGGVTLAAGPLIQLDRGSRRMAVLLVPPRSLDSRRSCRRAPWRKLFATPPARHASPGCRVKHAPIWSRSIGTNVGRLLAASATSDIADAHVVICARRAGTGVVTSDPEDLAALDPTLRLTVV